MLETIVFSLGFWLSVQALPLFKDNENMSFILMFSSVLMLITLAVTAQAYPWGYKLVIVILTGLVIRPVVKNLFYK